MKQLKAEVTLAGGNRQADLNHGRTRLTFSTEKVTWTAQYSACSDPVDMLQERFRAFLGQETCRLHHVSALRSKSSSHEAPSSVLTLEMLPHQTRLNNKAIFTSFL
ncbi:hypothetical protein CHARACLAT_000912 [Characodon lateralis]|uniref:Uncharacterized protein n=1 Tax=Characodon lateralis TaxID=208331 RepID=A0ABU7E5Y3_9TELE|nr:hypothetical protein [Characodon lateralis]